ncbi:unnamed protein product [Rotaria sp. Silwood1]|nr:unnamed protein product [Rotaria sp. Silwood1]
MEDTVDDDDEKPIEIDEALYSRQIYVIGKEAMYQMSRSHVLISGMRGLGVEIAKNIILAGVKSVTVQDSNTVDYADLSSQYYFNESDIGKNRAEVVHHKLAELNNYVHVKFSSKRINDHLTEDKKFNIIVLTNSSLDEQIFISEYCRKCQIKFLNASTKGLFGQIFCDLGENFQVIDTNGENPLVRVVTGITHDEDGIVFMPTDVRHGFEDGSYVTFTGVQGMTEVNDREFKINTPSPFTITIGNTSQFGIYEGGGTVTEVKKPETIHFVGSGAIGCEMLKNFAMMGIGCEKNGTVFLTDMDSIEKSNLNRQFLFRSSDISQMKSKVAAEAVRKMNPNINIDAYIDPVGPETEHLYSDDFFEQLNGVANALDNVKARQYIDRRCLYYQKPLIDSGTMGTKASVQVVVPFLTEPYSATHDPADASIPMCTLRNFPNLIEHTIEWARDNFEGLFTIPAQQVEEFIRDSNQFAKRISQCNTSADKNEMIENVKQILASERPKTFFDCIVWARNIFQKQFYNNIAQLLYNFPLDHVTKTGERFWSGNKRCPHPIEFDVSDKTHLDFIVAASNLIAYIYGIPQVLDHSKIASEVVKVKVPNFEPKTGVKIHENDEEIRAEMEEQSRQSVTTSNNGEEEIKEILAQLPKADKIRDIQIHPHEFEKDNDTNFHIDYIVATANLRAENYDIETADRSKIKRIAGHIIPAIATTTAMVTGLVCLEVYKLFQGQKNIESYRNSFANLALSFFSFSEPVPPTRKKVKINLMYKFE